MGACTRKRGLPPIVRLAGEAGEPTGGGQSADRSARWPDPHPSGPPAEIRHDTLGGRPIVHVSEGGGECRPHVRELLMMTIKVVVEPMHEVGSRRS